MNSRVKRNILFCVAILIFVLQVCRKQSIEIVEISDLSVTYLIKNEHKTVVFGNEHDFKTYLLYLNTKYEVINGKVFDLR